MFSALTSETFESELVRLTVGSRVEVSTHQGLSKNAVAEGRPESVAHSADEGPHSTSSRGRLKLVVRKAYSAKHRESLQSAKARTSSTLDLEWCRRSRRNQCRRLRENKRRFGLMLM